MNLVRSTGRPIAAVARKLGYDSTLGNWVRQSRIDRGEAEGLTTEVRARLRQLEAENARLRMERDLLKRNRGLLGQGTVDAVSRYRCVDAQKAAGFPVAAACWAAGVSTSAYHAFTARPSPSNPTQPRLVAEIRAIHTDSHGTYGSPRVTAELRRRGWRAS